MEKVLSLFDLAIQMKNETYDIRFQLKYWGLFGQHKSLNSITSKNQKIMYVVNIIPFSKVSCIFHLGKYLHCNMGDSILGTQ